MNLETQYLGLKLAHPIVASASPLSRELDGIRQLEDAGAAAIVMPSIYEEEIVAEDTAYEALVERGSWSQPEATEGYFPEAPAFRVGGLQARLETLQRAASACAIPIIASLNGSTPRGWTGFAAELERAGAAAIELNLYRVPADVNESGEEVERRWLETVEAVCGAVSIPVSVKLGPWLSSPGHHALRIAAAGARGLVLFNRFYQPDIDLATLAPKPSLELSSPYEIRQALLWIALLAGRVDASLAATSGVSSSEEVVKYLLAGADVVMTTSSLLRHGPGHVSVLRDGLKQWMEGRGFDDIGRVRGRLAAAFLRDREALVRAQYIHTLTGFQGQS
ncbi:MAG: dihydroorotate dehydrogenase-like protein [Bauldia sp.]|nr:dihydroorotate dehydrogenase-like protein [Bauldia sp.]